MSQFFTIYGKYLRYDLYNRNNFNKHSFTLPQVSQWMVGVKRLVNELKLNSRAPPATPTKVMSPLNPAPSQPSGSPAIPSLFTPSVNPASDADTTPSAENQEAAENS